MPSSPAGHPGLECIVHHLKLALCGRPVASFAKRLMVPVSNDALLASCSNEPARNQIPLASSASTAGPFAPMTATSRFVCDLKRRRIVTPLPDREIATVKAWLANHPEIAVVARNRGGGYGEARRAFRPRRSCATRPGAAGRESSDQFWEVASAKPVVRLKQGRYSDHRAGINADLRQVAENTRPDRSLPFNDPQADCTDLEH